MAAFSGPLHFLSSDDFDDSWFMFSMNIMFSEKHTFLPVTKVPFLSISLSLPAPSTCTLFPAKQVDLWLQKAWVRSCCRLGQSRAHGPCMAAADSSGGCSLRALQQPCWPTRPAPQALCEGSCLLVEKQRSLCKPAPSWREKLSFFHVKKQEVSSAAQRGFVIFRKNSHPCFPVAFSLHTVQCSSAPVDFLSHPLSLFLL